MSDGLRLAHRSNRLGTEAAFEVLAQAKSLEPTGQGLFTLKSASQTSTLPSAWSKQSNRMSHLSAPVKTEPQEEKARIK